MNAPATMLNSDVSPLQILPSAPISQSFSLYSSEAVAAVEYYGTILAESMFMGTSSKPQGKALVFFAMSENISITELKRRFHVMGKQLTMRAEYMLAEFRRIGGKYRWIDMGTKGDKAVLWLKYLDNEGQVEFTIEDAKRQGLVKPDSNWTKNPAAMLRARVSTAGIRAFAPEVLAGFYSDEELQGTEHDEIPNSVSLTVGENNAHSLIQKMQEEKQAATANSTVAEPPSSEQIETSTESLKQSAQQQLAAMATPEQLAELDRLFVLVGVTKEQQIVGIAKRGVSRAEDLSSEQISEMIANLKTKVPETDHMQTSTGVTSIETDGPITKELDAQIRAKIEEVAQLPGGMEIVTGLKEHLNEHNVKLVDLTFNEGRKMLAALEQKQLNLFIDLMLAGGALKN